MGRSGTALALLSPNESHYVDFLKLRKVNMDQAQPRKGESKCVVCLRNRLNHGEYCTAGEQPDHDPSPNIQVIIMIYLISNDE
jgi:hypothetical protein